MFIINLNFIFMFIVEEPRLNNIRLTILETSVAITDAEAQLCVTDATGPTTNEYHLLVRTGKHFQDLRDEIQHKYSHIL